ncbi:MAG: tRNA guanosine(34) transglycosylase Tgt [Leptospirales bacterium]
MKFRILSRDPHTEARIGQIETSHGVLETPAFMPVGTRATVRGVTSAQIAETGASILLVNLFHLWLRPGEKVINELGGVSAFMGWGKPVLSDSGGYQIYSLADSVKIREEGASFRSPYDGRPVFLSPEDVVRISSEIDVDLAMVLDHLVSPLAEKTEVHEALLRTLRWAKRSLDVFQEDRGLFGIVQGGIDPESRKFCARSLREMVGLDGQCFSGYGIGGLGIGESFSERNQVLRATISELEPEKPRYLMGIGYPLDILDGILNGVDLFDCVLPTRNGRNGMVFTGSGKLVIRNARFMKDEKPLDPGCSCVVCLRYSRAYIHHLFRSGEMLGPVLNTIHNLSFYMGLFREARTHIRSGTLLEWTKQQRSTLSVTEGDPS